MFSRTLAKACPLASSSKVYVDITNNPEGELFELSPATPVLSQAVVVGDHRTYSVYDLTKADNLTKEDLLNLLFRWKGDNGDMLRPLLHAERYVAGFGLQTGEIHTLVYNNHPFRAFPVLLLESVPWYLWLYIHTLKVTSKSHENKPSYIHYQPSKDRQRPHLLETLIQLPPYSVTEVTVQFERALLKWNEYPRTQIMASTLDPLSSAPWCQVWLQWTRTSPKSIRCLAVSCPTSSFVSPALVTVGYGSFYNLLTRTFQVDEPSLPLAKQLTNLIRRIRGVPLLT
ncbi:putative GPI transamidase component PIG-T [Triplophysa rosa]|uniref:GPI transamidase component PIG-T n=1 Tax=Triplophysa rosa TaxID=992332 RepID=A0A9W7TJ31_TRIRA|nr:putative GPI transamidase component PIG-T [Triplophysa rosa]